MSIVTGFSATAGLHCQAHNTRCIPDPSLQGKFTELVKGTNTEASSRDVDSSGNEKAVFAQRQRVSYCKLRRSKQVDKQNCQRFWGGC
ncbi:hypothetical protein GN956_G14387 [Arapaima gigas]